jgi:hypothetical protein
MPGTGRVLSRGQPSIPSGGGCSQLDCFRSRAGADRERLGDGVVGDRVRLAPWRTIAIGPNREGGRSVLGDGL